MFNPPKLKKTPPATVEQKPDTQTIVANTDLPPTQDLPPSNGPAQIGVEDGRFVERYHFHPDVFSTVSSADIAEILTAMGLVIDTAMFRSLPSRLKYHFLCLDRYGKLTRYGTREYSVNHPNEK